MQLFGWVRAEYGQSAKGKAALWTTLERLPFGDAMHALLHSEVMALSSPKRGELPYEQLQSLTQPYFPKWQRVLELPEQEFRDGEYTWRVSLGKAWRQIVAPADLILDDPAAAILDAFNFDCDQLCHFELHDRRGRTRRFACRHGDDEAFTDEVRLGELPLPEGGAMTFLFDYGDCWQFVAKLEKVTVAARRVSKPKVTARGGRAPKWWPRTETVRELGLASPG